LEQCEQFLTAAGGAGYATRPVQLFYALSQAGRAIVAASPHISNQAWNVQGHGLTAITNVDAAANVRLAVAECGLFRTVASALGVESFADEPVTVRELWALIPETAFVPLTDDVMFPVLLFFPDDWPRGDVFSQAKVGWIPRRVREIYGTDRLRIKEHLDRYPALRDSVPAMGRRVHWVDEGPGLSLQVEWLTEEPPLVPGAPPLFLRGGRTVKGLGVARYRSDDDFVVTPALGSMSSGLHPFLALWAVLLALSSLARYEPARWSRMIDIDRSSEANAIEHLLDESTTSVPSVVLHILSTFE
jgi:hypothetical protein